MANKILKKSMWLFIFSISLLSMEDRLWAVPIRVLVSGNLKIIETDMLKTLEYSTLYNHPILNPERKTTQFEGVPVEEILHAAGISLVEVRNIHFFGKDDYLVSIDAETALTKHEAMIVSNFTASEEYQAKSFKKLTSAVPFLVFKYGEELNRNFWCWWVNTILVELKKDTDYNPFISYSGKTVSLNQKVFDMLMGNDIINTSTQRGVTRYAIIGKDSKDVPLLQKSLKSVLRHFFGDIKDCRRMVIINLNGNESKIEFDGNIVLDNLFIGLTDRKRVYQKGFPAIVSLIKDGKFIIKNWPYLKELKIE